EIAGVEDGNAQCRQALAEASDPEGGRAHINSAAVAAEIQRDADDVDGTRHAISIPARPSFDVSPKILIIFDLRLGARPYGAAVLTGRKESRMKRFEVGARVVEPTYGLGSVIAVEDAYTRVQFDEHGVKKFMTSMSRLEPSNEPVPAGLRT